MLLGIKTHAAKHTHIKSCDLFLWIDELALRFPIASPSQMLLFQSEPPGPLKKPMVNADDYNSIFLKCIKAWGRTLAIMTPWSSPVRSRVFYPFLFLTLTSSPSFDCLFSEPFNLINLQAWTTRIWCICEGFHTMAQGSRFTIGINPQEERELLRTLSSELDTAVVIQGFADFDIRVRCFAITLRDEACALPLALSSPMY